MVKVVAILTGNEGVRDWHCQFHSRGKCSGPKLPPPNLPKISLSFKKRSHSPIKHLPEPQFISTGSGSKLQIRSDDRPGSKKGRVVKGKEISKVFNPGPISYISFDNEKVNVAHAMNEVMILEADVEAVRKITLLEMCLYVNNCNSVLTTNFQQVRLSTEIVVASDAELEHVKDTLHSFKNRAYIAEQYERELSKKVEAKEAEIEHVKKILVEE
ncbi:hypothetical protein FRX31_012255 [Thalictrum thalictroides]|uniref:Uncharacterized protein n=1 Tax=Thalictrum thalictroides TaxID=46969 RepID=A0A7J6WMG3_THATH|nr:hypothetical protein FRX31_012255 [Thalictrum thalictroides]